MKALVGAFNQEKALVGAFSVITNLRMELFEALVPCHRHRYLLTGCHKVAGAETLGPEMDMLILLMLMGVLSPRRLWENVLLSLFSFLRSSLVTFHADDRRREKVHRITHRLLWRGGISQHSHLICQAVSSLPVCCLQGTFLCFIFASTQIFLNLRRNV